MTSAKNMVREFSRWPNFEKAYLWAFERMLEGRHFDLWKNKYDVMEWYIYGVKKKYGELEGQLSFFEGDYYEQYNLPEAAGTVPDTIEAAKEILLSA